VIAVATYELPSEIAARLAEFCGAKKTGTLQLDVKDGRIIVWRITEAGRVDIAKR